MTRRLSITWPDTRPFAGRPGPFRILAASDEPDPFLDDARNRDALGRLDLIVGCGDLAPDRIDFLGQAFSAPIVFVRGNHDRGGPWPSPPAVPEPSSGPDVRSFPPSRCSPCRGPGREGDRPGVTTGPGGHRC